MDNACLVRGSGNSLSVTLFTALEYRSKAEGHPEVERRVLIDLDHTGGQTRMVELDLGKFEAGSVGQFDVLKLTNVRLAEDNTARVVFADGPSGQRRYIVDKVRGILLYEHAYERSDTMTGAETASGRAECEVLVSE